MIPLPRDKKIRKAVVTKYFATENWEREMASSTSELKRMSDYSGVPLLDLERLPLSLFLLIKRDSWIESMMKTETSREVLKNIWRLSQTEPDLEAIHRKQKEGGN